METLKIIFWICLIICIYTYIGYGIILYILVKIKHILFHKSIIHKTVDYNNLPEITLLICAYNEEDVIEKKMQNIKDIDYPQNKFKILWVTDGSTDKTNDILKIYQDNNTKIVFSQQRKGKTAALNHGMKEVKTPIVIFTDANTMMNKESLLIIVELFADEKVGCVSGEKRVATHSGNNNIASEGEGLYWKYESSLKRMDSELYSTMGAAGELYAIRTNLYETMPENTLLDDFIISMKIVDKGYRIAYTTNAYAQEYGSADIREEGIRKRRIAAGGIQSIWRLRRLLLPLPHPIIWFQYVSHRVLRWSLTPIAMLLLIPLNIMLLSNRTIYVIIFMMQAVFYSFSFIGYKQSTCKKKNKIAKLCYYFLFMNINVFRGIKYLISNNSGAWEKARRS